MGMDPIAFLAYAPGDARIAAAALERASKLRAEYDESLAKAIAVETANALLPGLVKSLNATISAIARSRP